MKLFTLFLIIAAALLQNDAGRSWSRKGPADRLVVNSLIKADDDEVSTTEKTSTFAAPRFRDEPIRINFQPAGMAAPSGYLIDSGASFGDRGNGYRYGWAQQNSTAHDRNAPEDIGFAGRRWPSASKTAAEKGDVPNAAAQIYGTLTHLQWAGADHVWEIELPNGFYTARLVAGDPSYYDSFYILDVEGVIAVEDIPADDNRWIEGTVRIHVADNRLTISNAAGACNNKLAFIEIRPAPAGPVSGRRAAAFSANPKPVPAPASFEGRGGVISGVVRSRTGAPLAGVRIAAISADEPRAASVLFAIDHTNAGGRYVLDGLPDGHYNVLAGSLTTPLFYPGVNAANGATTFTVSGKSVAVEDFIITPARLALICPSKTGPKE